jgi:hypothetical protein
MTSRGVRIRPVSDRGCIHKRRFLESSTTCVFPPGGEPAKHLPPPALPGITIPAIMNRPGGDSCYMANEEHVALLNQRVEVWNKWREKNSDIVPNLQGADLSGVKIVNANLRSVNLISVILARALFSGMAKPIRGNQGDCAITRATHLQLHQCVQVVADHPIVKRINPLLKYDFVI